MKSFNCVIFVALCCSTLSALAANLDHVTPMATTAAPAGDTQHGPTVNETDPRVENHYQLTDKEAILKKFAEDYLVEELKMIEANEVSEPQEDEESSETNTTKSRKKRDLYVDIGVMTYCTLPHPNDIAYINPEIQIYGSQGSSFVPGYRTTNQAASAITSMMNSGINRIIFITHGFTGDINDAWMHNMKNLILHYNKDQMVVLVGWRSGAQPWHLADPQSIYRQAAANTQVVGRFIGDVARVVKFSLPQIEIYGIGHSLGAHAMGQAGRLSGGVFNRITGLDPSGPCFQVQNTGKRLASTDAQMVDVIHSDGYSPVYFQTHFGTLTPLGDLDFYPNWGVHGQPGCLGFNWRFGCDHFKAIDYYIWSISNPGRFETRRRLLSTPTYYYIDTTVPPISTGRLAEMGYYADSVEYSRVGQYYIQTNSDEPYTTLVPHYFVLLHRQSGKVLDVCNNGVPYGCRGATVLLNERHGTDNQLWYRDGQLFRNKMLPGKVLEFQVNDYYQNNGWGRVYMSSVVHKMDNQRFSPVGNQIMSQWNRAGLKLDPEYNMVYNNIVPTMEVGCSAGFDGDFSQQWRMEYLPTLLSIVSY